MKIIHVADVHWGAEPDLGFAWSKERKAEIPLTFRKVITICRDEKTDLLLIAGGFVPSTAVVKGIKRGELSVQSHS